MARPIKKGLDYYPLNVDFLQDIKVRKIMRACGIQSITILISLLSSIYRDEGYYVVWDNDMSFLVADEVGASEGAVIEVVKKAVQVGFFNENIFKEYKVITSRGIQRRFIEATRRRKNIELFSEYILLDLDNEYNNLDNVNIIFVNGDRSTQSKEKKSKVKDSKVMSQNTCDDFKDNKYEFESESEEIRLVKFMISEMLRIKPDSKVPGNDLKSLQSWAKQVDYILRIDGKTSREVAELFRWAQEDAFWCANIRSPKKLREQWDQLELQRDNKRLGGKNSARNAGVLKENSDEKIDWAARAGVDSF